METIKVEFDDGSWWEIASVFTVGMAKAIAPLEAQVVNTEEVRKVAEKNQQLAKEGKPLKELPKMLNANGDVLNFEMTQELVFAATKAWSYGEVNRQVFDNEVPLIQYYTVSRRIDELSSSLPLVRT